jgi:putative DNA primase/helicase
MSAQFTDRFNAVRYYLDTLGLSIVPIQPGSKCPNIKGWNQPGGYYEPKHIDVALEFFKTHPKYNLGLVHGPSNTAAFDIDHNEYTRIALATLGIDLAEFLTAYPTPSIRGNPEKLAKPIYRVPAGVTLTTKKLSWPHPEGPDPKTGGKRLVTVFELRAGKMQDLIPPSLHPLGIAYSWYTDPEECPIAEMPPEILGLWQHWSEYEHDLLMACPWHKPEPRSSPKPPEHKEEPNGMIQAFNQAHDVHELLKKHGYKPKGNNRFVAPGSTSHLPGVKVFDDG